MMMGNPRTSCTRQCNKLEGGLLHTPKWIPTFMVIALLSLGNNVFVDSLFELALEPYTHSPIITNQ